MTKKIAVHWLRFGPYHIARMRAAHQYLAAHDIEAIGLATASKDVDYAWRESKEEAGYRQITAFPDHAHQHVSTRKLWQRYFRVLGEIRPDVVAIAGYSTPSALALITWCQLNRKPAILMTATKADDQARSGRRESIKRALVGRYRSAVCGGRHQRAYLEDLGMREQRFSMDTMSWITTISVLVANSFDTIPARHTICLVWRTVTHFLSPALDSTSEKISTACSTRTINIGAEWSTKRPTFRYVA